MTAEYFLIDNCCDW